MTLDLLRLVLGFVMLYYGAEWLVRGAAGLARALGVPPLVVGLTIVAYATSAPELVVSLTAALQGSSDIALGNVVGSNIANIGLILGVTALVAPPVVEGTLARRELPVLLGATAALPLMLLDGTLGRFDALLLVVGAAAFTLWQVRLARGGPPEPQAARGSESRLRLTLAGAAGLAVLVGGGKVFVDGAVGLALALGVSQRVVGLTIVAVGTSLPEMAASLVAAARGHSALAVGNVVGSNIFNILLILGVSGLVRPMTGSLAAMRLDFWTLGAATVACALFLRSARRIVRLEGAVLSLGYALFLVLLLLGG